MNVAAISENVTNSVCQIDDSFRMDLTKIIWQTTSADIRISAVAMTPLI